MTWIGSQYCQKCDLIGFEWCKCQKEKAEMTTYNEYYIPTEAEIHAVVVGSLAPDYTGKLAEVTEVYAKKQDVNGKWSVYYYTKLGEDGSISNNLKEGELHRSIALSARHTSHELDQIEKEMLQSF